MMEDLGGPAGGTPGRCKGFWLPPDCCLLPPDGGRCTEEIPRFFFNATSRKCQIFLYGGCRGNENRFEAQAECLHTCQHLGADAGSLVQFWRQPVYCHLPQHSGQSGNITVRFFYNSASGRCERFLYRGIGGNANNFLDEYICVLNCGEHDVCLLPLNEGFGDHFRPRYFYNHITMKCQKFWYRGKGGNANNFRDPNACSWLCSGYAEYERRPPRQDFMLFGASEAPPT